MKRVSLISAVLALGLTACGQDGSTIRIGFIGPLTGDAASFGADTLNGARIAVDEVNAGGGVHGKKVELIAEDGKCNGADAAAAAQKLVNIDKVVAIIGGQCSSETLAAAPIAEAAKVVLISPVSSSPEVTKAGDYVFRVYPSDALKGKALGAYLATAGFKKLAIISENTDYCQGMRDAVKVSLPKGTSLAFDEVVDQGTKDYRTLMTRLQKSDFDVFVANGQSDATVVEMVKQMRDLGMKQQIVGTDTSDSATLGQMAPEAVEGLKPLSVPSLSEDNPVAANYARMFRQRYDEPKFSMYFTALSHDAAKLAIEQIGVAGTGESLKNALYDLKSYDGVVGAFHFDQNGDVVGIPYAMKEFKNGQLIQSEVVPID